MWSLPFVVRWKGFCLFLIRSLREEDLCNGIFGVWWGKNISGLNIFIDGLFTRIIKRNVQGQKRKERSERLREEEKLEDDTEMNRGRRYGRGEEHIRDNNPSGSGDPQSASWHSSNMHFY